MRELWRFVRWWKQTRFHEKRHEMLMREYEMQLGPWLQKADNLPMQARQQLVRHVQAHAARVQDNLREWKQVLHATY